MKKLLIAAVIASAALAFAGCGNGKATSQEAVDELANPWVDMDTLEEAETAAGFTVEIPLEIALDEGTVYRYCEALKEIEVQFESPAYGYLRKAKDDGDISGDYQKYPQEKKIEVDGNVVTMKGADAEEYNLAVWLSGDYSYCIGFDEGVSSMEMEACVSELK